MKDGFSYLLLLSLCCKIMSCIFWKLLLYKKIKVHSAKKSHYYENSFCQIGPLKGSQGHQVSLDHTLKITALIYTHKIYVYTSDISSAFESIL